MSKTFIRISVICGCVYKISFEWSLKKVQKLNPEERKYCRTCGVFVCNSESNHEKHDLLTGIDDLMLNKPIISIIEPAVLNSSNAVKIEI